MSTVTFKYDPFGRRIQKAFTQDGTTTMTNYVYDGESEVETLSQSGSAIARYAQGQDIDEVLAQSASGAITSYEADGLGSVTSLTTVAGVLTNTYTYDSFGNLTSSTGTLANSFRFTGRDFDPEADLEYNRARYYDTTMGRFLNEDPIKFDGGINFYVYTNNEPIALIDASGMAPDGSNSGLSIVNLNDSNIQRMRLYPYPSSSRYFGNDQQCVSLTRYFTGLPCTDCWRAGPKVIGNKIPRGDGDRHIRQ